MELVAIILLGGAFIFLGFVLPIRGITAKSRDVERQRDLRVSEVEAQKRIAEALEEIVRKGKDSP